VRGGGDGVEQVATQVGQVAVRRADVAEDRLDDAPGLLDAVGAGEQPLVAVERVAEQALVGLLAGPSRRSS
jgi:hypothetical protein